MKGAKTLVFVSLFLFGVAALAAAQAEFVQTVTVTIKPGMVAEYEDYAKKIMAGASKVGAPQRVLAYQLALGGPGSTYIVALPFDKWGERDGWISIADILSKAYGEVEKAKIMKAGSSAVERSETAVYRFLKDLSTRPRAFDPPTSFISIIRTEVEPELSSAYELYLSKVKAAAEQAPSAPTAVRRVSVQGPALVYVTAQYFNKHAERDNWPAGGDLLRKAYGEAEGRHLVESSLRAVRKRDYWVLAYRPDLSRPTAGAAPTSN